MKHIFEYLFSKKSDLDKLSKTNRFGITEKDIIGDLKGFPVGVVIRMMEEQENQGNKPDIGIFQKNRCASKNDGGFDWNNTECAIWSSVLMEKHFDLFYKHYPEYKKYDL